MCSSKGLEISCCSLGKMKNVGFFFSIRKFYAKSWLQGFKEGITAHSFCVNQLLIRGLEGKDTSGWQLKYGNKLYLTLKHSFRTDSYKMMHHFVFTGVPCVRNHRYLPKGIIAKLWSCFFLFSPQHIFFLTYNWE